MTHDRTSHVDVLCDSLCRLADSILSRLATIELQRKEKEAADKLAKSRRGSEIEREKERAAREEKALAEALADEEEDLELFCVDDTHNFDERPAFLSSKFGMKRHFRI
jgi:hypothetical protein